MPKAKKDEGEAGKSPLKSPRKSPLKAKKPKDKNAPKKPSGAYIFFCNDKRAQVKAEHPEFSVADSGRKLGELWNKESDEGKKKYYEQAEADKERYAREAKDYVPPPSPEAAPAAAVSP